MPEIRERTRLVSIRTGRKEGHDPRLSLKETFPDDECKGRNKRNHKEEDDSMGRRNPGLEISPPAREARAPPLRQVDLWEARRRQGKPEEKGGEKALEGRRA